MTEENETAGEVLVLWNIYEIHILLRLYMKVKSDHRSKFPNNWKEEAWKISGLQRDIFQASSFQLLKLEIYCDDHSSLSVSVIYGNWAWKKNRYRRFFKITCPRNSLKNEFPNICTFCFRSLMRSCHLGILCKSSAGHSLPTRLSPCLHSLPFQLQCCQAV